MFSFPISYFLIPISSFLICSLVCKGIKFV